MYDQYLWFSFKLLTYTLILIKLNGQFVMMSQYDNIIGDKISPL